MRRRPTASVGRAVLLLLASAALTGLTGCDSLFGPAVRAELRTDHDTYQPGQLVIVSITNKGERTIYNDVCGSGTEGLRSDGQWNLPGGTVRGCFSTGTAPTPSDAWRGRPIEPGTTRLDTIGLSMQAVPATWRVSLNLRDHRGRILPEEQRTARFTITTAGGASTP